MTVINVSPNEEAYYPDNSIAANCTDRTPATWNGIPIYEAGHKKKHDEVVITEPEG